MNYLSLYELLQVSPDEIIVTTAATSPSHLYHTLSRFYIILPKLTLFLSNNNYITTDRYLHRVDDAIPEEPPVHGSTRFKARSQYCRGTQGEGLTPNVDTLLEQGVNWDYFIKEKATEDNCSSQNLDEGDILYSIGPRSGSSHTRQIIVLGFIVYIKSNRIVSYRIVSYRIDEALSLTIIVSVPFCFCSN